MTAAPDATQVALRYVKNQPVVTTPYLLMDYAAVERRYVTMQEAFSGVDIHYAVKCNPDVPLLRQLHRLGSGFEVASAIELDMLIDIGVNAADVLFSNPVKRIADIASAARAGVWQFAFDSEDELHKIARHAPQSAVYVRLSTSSQSSGVASEGKFGVDCESAANLMRMAKSLGLIPHGVTFHVGSQMVDPQAWIAPIERCGELVRNLALDGIRLSMIDVGGGFPVAYDEPVPTFESFAEVILRMVRQLPYSMQVKIEPGRSMVADSGVMVATVIGTARRNGRRWVHLDVGAFNGLMESLETQNALRYPVSDSAPSPDVELCHLTGPSCDSQDTILFDVPLSKGISTGDTVFIGNAGAYTTSYASNFNGFPIPLTRGVARDASDAMCAADVLELPK